MKKCVICENETNIEQFCSIDGYDYLKCGNCNYIYLDKIADTSEIFKSYIGKGFKKFRRRLLTRFRHFRHFRHFKFHMSRGAEIVGFIEKRISKKNIDFLDIGCNKGFTLANALKRGWNIYGVELVPELIAPFKRDHQPVSSQIFSGRFEDIQDAFSNDMFDAVNAIDVIEHLEDPIADLKNIYRVLKPGGIFVVQTPDSDSKECLELGCKWGELKPLEHLLIFNSENLELLARKIGFRDVEVIPTFTLPESCFAAILRK